MAPEMGGSTEMGCRTEATDEAIFFKVSASVSTVAARAEDARYQLRVVLQRECSGNEENDQWELQQRGGIWFDIMSQPTKARGRYI